MVLYDCLIKTQHFATRSNSKYWVWDLPSIGWLSDLLNQTIRFWRDTPINGGLTYEGRKVAEYLGR